MRGGEVVGPRGVCLEQEDEDKESEEEEEAAEVDVVAHLLLHGTHALEDVCRVGEGRGGEGKGGREGGGS